MVTYDHARRGLVRGLAVEGVGLGWSPLPGLAQSPVATATHDIVDNSGLAAFSGLVNRQSPPGTC